MSEAFAKNMGYHTNVLPMELAKLGADVHIVTTRLPPYHGIRDFDATYGRFHSLDGPVPATEVVDGVTVHYLPHRPVLGYVRIEGLGDRLAEIRPDVVQSNGAIGWHPLDCARAKLRLGFKLFTNTNTTASVFPMAARPVRWWEPEHLRSVVTRALPGRIVSLLSERCFAATEDCADVGRRFFGIEATKMVLSPLGVDTELFTPVHDAESRADREATRARLGFGADDVVCIYTGRFTEDKNPLALARAIGVLRAGGEDRFRAVFFGDGPQRDAIAAVDGCVVQSFVPYRELAGYFRAADVGVWPTQESTSMLDAAASGLPIVVNHTVVATERHEGNGLTYRLNDVDDLARVLRSLADPALRARLGAAGTRKMRERFSWRALARRRLEEYRAALDGPAAVPHAAPMREAGGA